MSSPGVRALAVWLLLLVVVVSLGAVRGKRIRSRLGEFRAHQAGTLAAAMAVRPWRWGPSAG